MQAALAEDYEALGRQLARRGISIEAMTERAMAFSVAVPTWGVGTGGTRFARFPGPGEPRHIHDKLEDCGVINQLTRVTPNVSPHFPWDKVKDYNALRQEAASHELGFDAVNSNTFQDQRDQRRSYKFGSLTHADKGTRAQAVEHNLECIEIGKAAGFDGADRLDCRWLQLSGPVESQCCLRPLHRIAADHLRRLAEGLVRVPRAQAL